MSNHENLAIVYALSMEHTVTTVAATDALYQVEDRVRAHVQEMARNGWVMITAVSDGNLSGANLMMFWGKGDAQ